MTKKIALCWPWDSPFVYAAGCQAFLNMQIPDGYEARWFRGRGWCSARMHTDAFEQALEWGADLIANIGSDQIHPEDTLPKLVKHIENGCDAVAGWIPFRGYLQSQDMEPFGKMAWNQVGDGRSVDPVPVRKEDGDLQKIDFIGSGVMLFQSEHLRKLKRPWCWDRMEDRKRLIRKSNFDVEFVYAFQRELGVQWWLDTTIDVKHLHIFEIDETFPRRFQDWKTPGNGDPSVCIYDAPIELSDHPVQEA